ncbi:hypothetical protein [Alloactinosynnema sp. L-07]|uniref:hypothetical protein n=1 Tax=Alloactinosynnema sp. L-07 TaxID=1653480 RepID=UPI00065EFC43|nr:hypothetical protein [Alloactinosynnema sp. L-07]CRK59597.1 hypothetical protein [Alloactinosynnema sp. L-07]
MVRRALFSAFSVAIALATIHLSGCAQSEPAERSFTTIAKTATDSEALPRNPRS